MRLKMSLIVSSLLIFCFLLLVFAIPVQGEDVNFSVKAILPENQVDQTKSYFDLTVKEDDTQQLQAIIYNHEDEDITVRLSVNPATTNSNGLIIYEETDELDPSLKIALPEILQFPNETVTIPAGNEKTVSATLRTPKVPFNGIILGGLHFEKVNNEDGISEGVNIENKYAYVIGVQIAQNDRDITPDLQLQKVYADLVNHRPAVTAQIQNSHPTIISNLMVHTKIYDKNKTKLINEKIQKNINMAPNSHLKLNIDWNNEPLHTGTYIMEIKAKHETDIWEWQEEINIEKEEVKQINSVAVNLDKQNNSWYHAELTILAVIIIILIIYIQKLKRKQRESEG